jgi:hypothetical protein
LLGEVPAESLCHRGKVANPGLFDEMNFRRATGLKGFGEP